MMMIMMNFRTGWIGPFLLLTDLGARSPYRLEVGSVDRPYPCSNTPGYSGNVTSSWESHSSDIGVWTGTKSERWSLDVESVAAVWRTESWWLAALSRSAGRRLPQDQTETQRSQETHRLRDAATSESAAATNVSQSTGIGLIIVDLGRVYPWYSGWRFKRRWLELRSITLTAQV